jgi:hypothetical protein
MLVSVEIGSLPFTFIGRTKRNCHVFALPITKTPLPHHDVAVQCLHMCSHVLVFTKQKKKWIKEMWVLLPYSCATFPAEPAYCILHIAAQTQWV